MYELPLERKAPGVIFRQPVNEPLAPLFSGNSMINPNRWQPLSLNVFIDQSGNILEESTPEFLGAEWGNVNPFGLNASLLNQVSYHLSSILEGS